MKLITFYEGLGPNHSRNLQYTQSVAILAEGMHNLIEAHQIVRNVDNNAGK